MILQLLVLIRALAQCNDSARGKQMWFNDKQLDTIQCNTIQCNHMEYWPFHSIVVNCWGKLTVFGSDGGSRWDWFCGGRKVGELCGLLAKYLFEAWWDESGKRWDWSYLTSDVIRLPTLSAPPILLRLFWHATLRIPKLNIEGHKSEYQ